ncbi:MAG: hypothetical protein ABI367_09840 [Mucilaginibacter sp.]
MNSKPRNGRISRSQTALSAEGIASNEAMASQLTWHSKTWKR